MIREQRIMQRIIDEIGPEFDEYIMLFNGCCFWDIKEGEILINKTFKRLLEIIADFNLTTVDEIMDQAFKFNNSPEANMRLLRFFSSNYIEYGGDCLLLRSASFCFTLWLITQQYDVTACYALQQAINSEIVYKKETLWTKIKHFFGFIPYPYIIRGQVKTLTLITLLNGKPMRETMKYIAEYNNIL